MENKKNERMEKMAHAELKQEFTDKGIDFKLVKSTPNGNVVYAVFARSTKGQDDGFEVWVIGSTFRIPKDEDFGKSAWVAKRMQDADRKIKELLKGEGIRSNKDPADLEESKGKKAPRMKAAPVDEVSTETEVQPAPASHKKDTSAARLPKLFELGLVKAGDKIHITIKPEATAEFVDAKTVKDSDGNVVGVNVWGQKVTGWKSLNIYTWIKLEKNGKTLEEIRKEA